MSQVIQFQLDGEQITIDLSPFVFGSFSGNAPSEANKVYIQCLQLFPRLESVERRLRAIIHSKYLDSDLKGASGRKSNDHFEMILFQEEDYVEAHKNFEIVKRLVKDGIPGVLNPNMRTFATGTQAAEQAYNVAPDNPMPSPQLTVDAPVDEQPFYSDSTMPEPPPLPSSTIGR